jgi:endonuclease YncB( thermonuclease family)
MIVALLAASAYCLAIDGDTLVCRVGLERVHLRLNAIDAPELPGHCRAGRHCVAGDPFAAKANVARLIAGHVVRWRDLGTDRYGRTVAEAYADGVDLSCAQVRGGFAVYVGKWDNEKLLARTCR